MMVQKFKWSVPMDPNDWRTHVEKQESEIERLTTQVTMWKRRYNELAEKADNLCDTIEGKKR